MREGSYTQIERGMEVVGRDGETIGGVREVIVDEASDIFVGLAVKPNLFVHSLLVPGELVERLHDRKVYVDAVEAELETYVTPEERHHETEQAYEEANR
ncbi:MAG: PRC-barrel domain-containing protein [Armatimonadota bacterium]